MIGINLDIDSYDISQSQGSGLFGRHSYGRYSYKAGISRILDLFEELHIKCTFFIPIYELKNRASELEAVFNSKHEIAIRGYTKVGISENEELDALQQDYLQAKDLLGYAPKGWRSFDGNFNPTTLINLAKAGYLYDSSFLDDDQPYLLSDGATELVEIPVFDYLSDARFYSQRHTMERVKKVWMEEVASHIQENLLINLTLHTRGDVGSTRLPRINIVKDIISWLKFKKEIEILTGEEIAKKHKLSSKTEEFPIIPIPNI